MIVTGALGVAGLGSVYLASAAPADTAHATRAFALTTLTLALTTAVATGTALLIQPVRRAGTTGRSVRSSSSNPRSATGWTASATSRRVTGAGSHPGGVAARAPGG